MNNAFELRKTSEKGEGVFALRPFKANEIVIIGFIECVLKENNAYASQIGENTYVLHGGLMPKCNHSCDPNCGIKVNSTGAHDLVARRDIFVGEELTYDYAMRNYSIEHFPSCCSCGSGRCRVKITGWKDLSQEIKEEYKEFSAPYLWVLDQKKSLLLA